MSLLYIFNRQTPMQGGSAFWSDMVGERSVFFSPQVLGGVRSHCKKMDTWPARDH